jgi:glycosyltransferase involved in cell wall biosynthesis
VAAAKIMMVGPYPPPEGGWSTLIKEERDELLSRGVDCRVLNIGVNRNVESDEYITVQNGFDLFIKLFWYSMAGYRFRLHMNGDSRKGMQIVLLAEILNLLFFRRACLSFHAGTKQTYFPDRGSITLVMLWRVIFNLAGIVICDCDEVRELILRYKKNPGRVRSVSPFSNRRVQYEEVKLGDEIESFLSAHSPLLFTYIAYRHEYSISILLEAIGRLAREYERIGLLVVDDRTHPDPEILEDFDEFIDREGLSERIFRTGNVERGEFLTLLSRSDLLVRTPVTDGICSSVLEALYLGIPVVAAENDNRPEQVVTYEGASRDDLTTKVIEVLKSRGETGLQPATFSISDVDSVVELVDIVLKN